jgi:nucleoside phosphorylase
MNGRSVLIFTAMQMEASAVAAALKIPMPAPSRPTQGTVDALQVSLHLIGIGAKGLHAIELLETPSCVIMAGLAGALDPILKVGDIVMSGGEQPPRKGARHGSFHTSDKIISTPQQKAELFQATGAAAVDMEGSLVANWLERIGSELITIRAISDSASQAVDPRVLALVDQWGRPRAAAVIRLLIRRPLLVTLLIRLSRDSRFAAARLGEAVRLLLRELAESSSDNL